MVIYNGSTEIKDLYYGNQKIGEAYYGGTKVYSSFSPLPVWKFTYSSVVYYLIGSYSTNGLLSRNTSSNEQITTITSITGTLGTSESTIVTHAAPETFDYKRTFSLNGKTVHCYQCTQGIIGMYLYVLDGSSVGSTVFYSLSYIEPTVITNITDSSITSYMLSPDYTETATRDSTYLKYWTKDGLIE